MRRFTGGRRKGASSGSADESLGRPGVEAGKIADLPARRAAVRP